MQKRDSLRKLIESAVCKVATRELKVSTPTAWTLLPQHPGIKARFIKHVKDETGCNFSASGHDPATIGSLIDNLCEHYQPYRVVYGGQDG